MKKLGIILLALFMLVGCSNNKQESKKVDGKIAVVYFSATHNTEKIAEMIGEITGGKVIEIIPEKEYSEEDLEYTNDSCRANLEMEDVSCRPGISNSIELDEYDTIYLGYPIWWGKEPRIILTLLDQYDLTDKNIILFCTSASSNIEASVKDIENYQSDLNILEGKRWSASASKEELEEWISTIE